jgi:hypothetical protein
MWPPARRLGRVICLAHRLSSRAVLPPDLVLGGATAGTRLEGGPFPAAGARLAAVGAVMRLLLLLAAD